tara:strand:+ start:12282 stop:13556 length:1275 start_codon:yes stop_codon:yes gene_type:complete
MKEIFNININVLLIVSLWIFLGFFSTTISIISVFLSFFFLIYKDLKIFIFLLFYMILVISDSRLSILSFATTIKPFIAILFFFYCIIFHAKSSNKDSISNLFFFTPFVFFVLVSFFIGGFNITLFQKSISFILLFTFTPYFINFLFFQNNKTYLKTLVYLLVSFLFLGLIMNFLNKDLVIINDRFRGLFGNPNGLAISALLSLFFFNHIRTIYKNIFSKNEVYFVIIILILNIVLSESRSCILSLLIYYSFILLLKYSFQIAIVFSSFILIAYGFLAINPLEFVKVLGLESFIRLETIENASGRYIAWNFLINHFDYKNIFFGNGIGSTEILFKNNYSLLSSLGHQGNAHNSFLTILYDTGLLGLISFIFFIFYNAYKSNNAVLTIPIILGVFISALYESWLSASLNPFTIIFLLIIVSFSIDR